MNELIGAEVMIYLLGVVSGIILSMLLVTLAHITTKRRQTDSEKEAELIAGKREQIISYLLALSRFDPLLEDCCTRNRNGSRRVAEMVRESASGIIADIGLDQYSLKPIGEK
jgi:Na+-transporting NADH:ubiquinone oxidoreductase subunit NqrC